jgi:putative phosphoribosyl transferase
MPMPFRDRRDAGRHLAEELSPFASAQPLVLALPRGGVPVAYEVATRLRAPLDVLIVRKLGAPRHPELAMGAIASGGAVVLNADVLRSLRIGEAEVQREAARQAVEVARRTALYRRGSPAPDVRGRTVVLVDDGLATGSTMQVAVKALREYGPARVVVAVPVAAPEARELLTHVADEVVCVEVPADFRSVGRWYQDFEQTVDDEVRSLLAAAQSDVAAAYGGSAPEAGRLGFR